MTVALGEGFCRHGELSIVYCSRCIVFYIFTLRIHETVAMGQEPLLRVREPNQNRMRYTLRVLYLMYFTFLLSGVMRQ